MKYKLLKDLPFAKAGEEVLSNEPPAKRIKDDTIKTFIRVATNNIYGLTEFDIPTDTFYDWIEEVKPREFYVEIRKNDGVATDVYEGEMPDSLNMIDRYNYIKVREVIE